MGIVPLGEGSFSAFVSVLRYCASLAKQAGAVIMQVNQPKVSIPTPITPTTQKQMVVSPQPTVSESPPQQTKPKEQSSETVPLGSSQEGQQIQSQLSSTPPRDDPDRGSDPGKNRKI